MADPYVERVAGELADMALADEAATGERGIIDNIGNILGASSQTLEEAFLTAVRVRRAETRARELLGTRAATRTATGQDTPAQEDGPEALEDKTKAPDPAQDDLVDGSDDASAEDEEDDAFADVLSTLDDFLQDDDGK